MRGLVSLVGVGPGDPGLLTLRGASAIQRADTVLHDALVHPMVLRHARTDAEVLFVGKRHGVDSATQDEINHMLLFRARQGRRVARLKGGDPLLFGRGAEEAEFLAAEGIPFEVIPGITAALGAAAYAGIPLSHRDLSSSVAFVTATARGGSASEVFDGRGAYDGAQTLVLYMAMHRLRETLEALIANGRARRTPAAVIQWGTWPGQRVITATLGDLADRCDTAGVGSPAVVIVGEVVPLRNTLRWWDTGPLAGRRVLVTRAREQAGTLVAHLVERGAEPLEFPAISFEDPTDPAPALQAVSDLAAGAYQAVAFTSQNGVARFFALLEANDLDARAFGVSRVVAIGPATAEALRARGLRPDAVAREFIGEGVAAAVLSVLGDRSAGARILVPRAQEARDVLPVTLRAAGATVDVVAVYRTVPAPRADVDALRTWLAEGTVDVTTFTSGSTVTQLCDALGADAAFLLNRTRIASIGPVTSRTARARGLVVAVEASEFTIAGLLAALEQDIPAGAGQP